ncbi:hypothetical protein H0H81_002404 [Sphagnurus paluster]|uniref:CxC2-like cysteine cluster KDZ transposase-associated domain-containing protein n=1 Tax=Sphagnurus paluster TaxID=117069 RepID=A0A9P7FM53_9AGAR|nr:hypothetical protein H0H81_002404 [Sphagnurus paluster]
MAKKRKQPHDNLVDSSPPTDASTSAQRHTAYEQTQHGLCYNRLYVNIPTPEDQPPPPEPDSLPMVDSSIDTTPLDHAETFSPEWLTPGYDPDQANPLEVSTKRRRTDAMVSAFEFYQTLIRQTENTVIAKLLDRYDAFLCMVQEWCHLRMLKRAGRGHDLRGVKATSQGECVILCPACPLPGINLPPKWRDAPEEQAWLYALFVEIDANFCLKCLKMSSDEQDPGLNHGYVYFVNDCQLKDHIHAFGPNINEEDSTCNNHDTIKSASICGGKGVDASGVGKTEFPKFHLPTHKPECHVNFSFNFTPHVGCTDGEALECGWAAINAVSSSTKNMGPGSRRDTLDDHFGDYNWRKSSIASTFLRKAHEAVEMREELVLAFEAFDAALPTKDTKTWTDLVQMWEKGGTEVNPFATKFESITENAVHLKLAREEQAQLTENLTHTLHEDVSPTLMIAQGLELEDHQ